MGNASDSMLIMVAIFLALYFAGVGVYMAVKLVRKVFSARKDRKTYG